MRTKSGTLTLESLAWLRAIGAAIVHLNADGQVLTHSVPFGYEGLIRRSQALAIAHGLHVDLARDLIRRKFDGQRANLARLGATDIPGFDAMREGLDRAATIDEIRLCDRIASRSDASQAAPNATVRKQGVERAARAAVADADHVRDVREVRRQAASPTLRRVYSRLTCRPSPKGSRVKC